MINSFKSVYVNSYVRFHRGRWERVKAHWRSLPNK